MRFIILSMLAITWSCAHKPNQTGKAIIIKQWHTSPKVDTRNIQASKSLPQYQNQKEIYDYLSHRIKTQGSTVLLVEGCERGNKIDEKFTKTFNGWNMTSLSKASSWPDYDSIITALPLKLKAKFPDQVTAICADNEELMEKNQLAISDARGFLGFYLRLKQNAADSKKFLSYKKALEEAHKIEVTDPVTYTKTKALQSIESFNSYIQQRNTFFIEAIKDHLEMNPILIVGGLHAKDIVKKLQEEGIETEVITPNGYPVASERLTEDLVKVLEQGL